jgi:hypothetical protein
MRVAPVPEHPAVEPQVPPLKVVRVVADLVVTLAVPVEAVVVAQAAVALAAVGRAEVVWT